MADSSCQARYPGLAPLIAKRPDEYYYGTRRFSDDALNLICCCAIFSTYHPDMVASLFRGDLNKNCSITSKEKNFSNGPPTTKNRDLFNVHGSEIHGCFFQMLDSKHPIYQQWNRRNPSPTISTVAKTMQPFIDVGETDIRIQCWNAAEGPAEPFWKRDKKGNAVAKRRFKESVAQGNVRPTKRLKD